MHSPFLTHSRAVPGEEGCREQALINGPVSHQSLHAVGRAPVSYSVQASHFELFRSFDNWIAFCLFSPMCIYGVGRRVRGLQLQVGAEEREIPPFPEPGVPSHLTLGTPQTPSSSEVSECLPPTELGKNEKPEPCQEKADVEYCLPSRAIMRMKTSVLASRKQGDGSHSETTCVREESGANAEEKLPSYLRQRNIFKRF
ncbi:hypothetical protein llap_1166 [Limosa lapponica baueri]|uniref:Uncharacterized protein n=1 Tax=Limosa lapponica baueri TaxID=1758121 RepID=A0A2I0UR63_LIMLA|nr:hypothetical protein llap_1166 [Limosa lapponica baueri]